MYFKIILATLMMISNVYASDFRIISNERIDLNQVTKESIRSLYLGKTNFIPNVKGPIAIAIYTIDPRDSKELIKAVLKVRKRKFDSIWRKKLFSGSAVPPLHLKSSTELTAFIKDNKYPLVLTKQKIQSLFKQVEFKGD